jgi:hypothetical protein
MYYLWWTVALASFLRVLRFALPILIPPNTEHSVYQLGLVQEANLWPTYQMDSVSSHRTELLTWINYGPAFTPSQTSGHFLSVVMWGCRFVCNVECAVSQMWPSLCPNRSRHKLVERLCTYGACWIVVTTSEWGNWLTMVRSKVAPTFTLTFLYI